MTEQIQQLLAAITEDPDREPFEKETGLLWSKDADAVSIHTAEAGLMRRFVRHPLFDLERVELSTGGGSYTARSADDLPSNLGSRSVYTVFGTIPIGCVSIKSSARSDSTHSRVVSQSALIEVEE